MSESQTAADETQTASVSESKFNGTATLNVKADTERQAESAARRYFKQTHGTSPDQVMVQEVDRGVGSLFDNDAQPEFDVIVVDSSSGSLADSKEFEF